jgi:4-hydroxy-3-methylbut-2-enyl diphosphate reductase
MQVLRAEEMGMCFGVRDALKILDDVRQPETITIHGELVHNEAVLTQLGARGFRMAAEQQRDMMPTTDTVLITAHGISDRERSRLEAAGKQLIDTTCPLVLRVHQAASSLQREGFHILLIGKPDHVEVRGIVEDLSHYDVVPSPSEARAYASPKLAIICQTTVAPRMVAAIHSAIVAANPTAEIRFVDTTCQPTRNRQRSVEKLIPFVQAMVVVGGRNSNNTRELADLCRQRGLKTFHVQGVDDLRPEWFRGIECVGLTAGTSTLDETIRDVQTWLANPPVPNARRQTPEFANKKSVLTSRQWIDHFARNASKLRSIPWEQALPITDGEREILTRSLTAWQLGETSEGSHLLKAAESYAMKTDDSEFVDAVRLFIREEQRHGEWLGQFLDRVGIDRIRNDLGDTAFRIIRYCLPNFETWATPVVMVETLAVIYYDAIRRQSTSPALREICAQILSDEIPHIRFQCEHLATVFHGRAGWRRWLTRFGHTILFAGIALAVWIGHRRAFARAGYSFRGYWQAAWRKMRRGWGLMQPERYQWSAGRRVIFECLKPSISTAANGYNPVPSGLSPFLKKDNAPAVRRA